jgi:hypothetical protein
VSETEHGSEPTTVEQLHRKYREALDSALAGREDLAQALDDALDAYEIDLIPRVWGDDRRWRILLDGHPLRGIVDADQLALEVALTLIRQPVGDISVRPAVHEEIRVSGLRGAEGLDELDRRQAEILASLEVPRA